MAALYCAGSLEESATNCCVCGFLTDPQKEYTCTPLQIQCYRSQVSGPLLDRIDIQVEVPALRYREVTRKDSDESSTVIRERASAARTIQLSRFQKTKLHANAQMAAREIKRYSDVNTDAEKLLETAINKLGLSTRAYSRVLKVSRTIADLVAQKKFKPHTSLKPSSIEVPIGTVTQDYPWPAKALRLFSDLTSTARRRFCQKRRSCNGGGSHEDTKCLICRDTISL